jgi:hypothetical protein
VRHGERAKRVPVPSDSTEAGLAILVRLCMR